MATFLSASNYKLTRQREKLEKNFGSIRNMKGLPAALLVVDVMYEHIAVREAKYLAFPYLLW